MKSQGALRTLVTNVCRKRSSRRVHAQVLRTFVAAAVATIATASVDAATAVNAKPPALRATPEQALAVQPRQPVAPPTLLQTPTAPAPQPDAQPRFTGHPITLDFQGADLRAVLRTFSEISGLNIVIDSSITGSVDVSLRDVPWDQALDIIFKANKLGYSVDGTIVRIAPISVLADEEAERRKLTEAQALAGELRVLTHPLSYARAQDLVPIVTRSALSSRGEVQVDGRTNTLIIRDLADRLQGAADIVAALDRPQPQVEIEARIIQTTRDFARAFGVQWGFTGRADASLGNTTGLAFPNSGSLTGRLDGTQGPTGADSAVNLAASGAGAAIGLALGSINGAFNLDVALSALERQGHGRLLSTPRVSTQNNVEAEITQGVQIPIQTVANNTVTVQFRDAALTLRVTPQITASNTVIMRISLENATPDFSRAINGIPPINTQRALTSVLVGDGETTVIGGIYLSNEQTNEDKVPVLNRLPLLGWLFRRNVIGDESRELLIFITPRITRS
jgi:type IV pilus assembly protein PilQ